MSGLQTRATESVNYSLGLSEVKLARSYMNKGDVSVRKVIYLIIYSFVTEKKAAHR